MGTLKYSSAQPPLALPDRVLEHLHIVIARTFRQQQRFALNVISDAAAPIQVWLDARVPIVVTYATRVGSTINERWVKELEATFSSSGLVLVAEPA